MSQRTQSQLRFCAFAMSRKCTFAVVCSNFPGKFRRCKASGRCLLPPLILGLQLLHSSERRNLLWRVCHTGPIRGS
jgi:hypothetical protein